MKRLIDIPGADPANAAVLESGIFPSLPAKQQKLWLEASNVDFVDRAAEKSKGFSNLGDLGATITALSQAYVDGERRVYLGTPETFNRYTEGDTIELASGFNSGRWSIIPWGTWVLATNGFDPVQVSKNTTDMEALANVPVETARIIRKLAQRPIIFAGQNAYWPRATDIEYWTTPDPTGRAGSFFIRDLDSDVIAVEPLGELLAYYTANKMGLVTFIGGQEVYGFKNKLEGIGAIGIDAVVPVGAYHYGLSANGIWRTDGVGYNYIDAPGINRFFDAFLDKDRGDEVKGVHVKDRTTVEWHFRSPDDGYHGLGFNYANGAWQHYEKAITAVAPQEVFTYPLSAAGSMWGLYDNSSDLGTQTMTSSLSSGPFDAGDPQAFKWWDKVEINIEAAGQVEIRFGLHRYETFGSHVDDRWLDWQTLAVENWIAQESVYLSMQLRSTEFASTWRIGGLSVWGEMAGRVS